MQEADELNHFVCSRAGGQEREQAVGTGKTRALGPLNDHSQRSHESRSRHQPATQPPPGRASLPSDTIMKWETGPDTQTWGTPGPCFPPLAVLNKHGAGHAGNGFAAQARLDTID